MNKKINLSDLKAGDSAKIISVGGEGALRQHFLDMGLIKGTTLSLIKLAPMGDPLELQLHGYDLTLRLDDAKKIEVEPIVSDKTPKKANHTSRFLIQDLANITKNIKKNTTILCLMMKY